MGNTADGEGDAVYSASNITNATTVMNSCIVGNGNTSAFNELSASQNFTHNWWGDARGLSVAGSVYCGSAGVNINFSPWLTEAPSICAP